MTSVIVFPFLIVLEKEDKYSNSNFLKVILYEIAFLFWVLKTRG